MPGDPAVAVADATASLEEIDLIRHSLGLYDPLYVQYYNYMKGIFIRGELAFSFRGGRRDMTKPLIKSFRVSVSLALIGLGFAVIIGIPLGVIAALKRESYIDFLIMVFSVIGVSMPIFWLGLLLILLFSLNLGFLPSAGWGTLQQMILPGICLSFSTLALITRMSRSSMLEVMFEDYIRTARAKGLSERVVVLRHALKNAMIPIVTVAALRFGPLLGGAIIVETIFGIPGTGRLLTEAVMFRDMPLVQGGILIMSLAVLSLNLIVDLIYGILDPRIRL